MVCLKVGSLSGSLSVASNINLLNSKFAATAVNNTKVNNRETNHPDTNKAPADLAKNETKCCNFYIFYNKQNFWQTFHMLMK